MTLPHNLTLLPGIRSDHKGQKYQYAQYPSGKTVVVPYSECATEPARMIPLPVESSRLERSARGVTSSSRRVNALVVQVKQDHMEKYRGIDKAQFNALLQVIKPLMRSPDCGRTWVPAEPVYYVHHYCYHYNEGDVDPFQVKEKSNGSA